MEMLSREPRVLKDTHWLVNSFPGCLVPTRKHVLSPFLLLSRFSLPVTKCHMVVRVNRGNLCAIGSSYAWNSIISDKVRGTDRTGGNDDPES